MPSQERLLTLDLAQSDQHPAHMLLVHALCPLLSCYSVVFAQGVVAMTC